MITLYHSAQSRSVRPRWLLEELGVPYELKRIDIKTGEQKKLEYLKLNPNGTVPTLVDGDTVLFESAANCLYLADKYADKRLAPPVGSPARGPYYQWVLYAMCTLEPPIVALFLHTVQRPEAERIPALATEARAQLKSILDVVERALQGRSFILGEAFTTADVMMGSTLGWARMMGIIGAEQVAVSAYLDRLMARPAFQKAFAD